MVRSAATPRVSNHEATFDTLVRHHALRQPGREQRERDQDDETHQIGRDERDHALEDGGKRNIFHHALDDEDVHADRRMNQPQFHRHHDDDAEPDRIKSQMRHHRKDDRHGQDDHGHGVHQAAEHQIHHHDHGQYAV